MKQILANHLGKSVVIHFGSGSSIKGKLTDVADGVAQVEGEESTMFVSIDKIDVFWEEKDREKPLGFAPKPSISNSQ